jgi:hypothetical protein
MIVTHILITLGDPPVGIPRPGSIGILEKGSPIGLYGGQEIPPLFTLLEQRISLQKHARNCNALPGPALERRGSCLEGVNPANL